MKKSIPDRQYTGEFREAAVSQVLVGERSIRQVARSLEMSSSTLGKWVSQARKGQSVSARSARAPPAGGRSSSEESVHSRPLAVSALAL